MALSRRTDFGHSTSTDFFLILQGCQISVLHDIKGYILFCIGHC